MPGRRQKNFIPVNYHRVLEFGAGFNVTESYGPSYRGGKTEITTITPSGSGHTVSYGVSNTPPAGTSAGQVYHQTSTGTQAGVLMNTWTYDGSTWFNESQPINVTRAQLIALRNAGQLRQSQHYLITDHVQGQLVAGTTILVHATADNEISENVTVNTTYDNEGWRGIYDADRALVLELQDNRNNIARGVNGNEVSNFDWGNTSYSNVVVDNATLTVNIGNTATKQNITVEKGAVLNLTNFVGAMNNITFSTVVNANFTGANGTWRLSTVRGGGNFNVSGYTGGGDNYCNQIDGASNINFSNSSSLVVFRQNTINASTITHSGVSTGTFTLVTSNVENSNITHAVGAGNFSATGNNQFLSGANTSHTTGTMTLTNVHNYSATIQQGTNAGAVMNLNQAYVKHGANISNQATGTLAITQSEFKQATAQRQAGATGSLTINYSDVDSGSNVINSPTNTGNTLVQYSKVSGSSAVNNASAVAMTITRGHITAISDVTAAGGSGGVITVSDTRMLGSCTIRKQGASTAGTLSVTGGSDLQSSGFVQSNSIGNLTVSQASIIGSSGINVNGGDRNYNFARIVQSGVSRANLSGTGAAITDNHNELEMHYRGTYNNSCTGAANSMLYTEITGLSGTLNLTGTTGGKSFNRVKIYDGQLTSNNNPNSATLQLWSLRDAGVVNITANGIGDIFNYVDVDNQSNVLINKTSVSNISGLKVTNSGAYNMTGTAGAVSKVHVEQGILSHSGGTLTNVSKKMTSTFTVTGGTQNNVHHWNTANKTTNVNNTNKVDYLGVVSTAPIL